MLTGYLDVDTSVRSIRMSSLPIDRILRLASILRNTTTAAMQNMVQLKTSMVYASGLVGFLVKWGSSRRRRTDRTDVSAMPIVAVERLVGVIVR